MRKRWIVVLSTLLGLSLWANIGLVVVLGYQSLDYGLWQSDQESSWRSMAAERRQLQDMRQKFCPADPTPSRQAVLSWEKETSGNKSNSEPFEKSGMLWLRDVGIKFDAEDRLAGVCLNSSWQLFDGPDGDRLENAGQFCPVEPLC